MFYRMIPDPNGNYAAADGTRFLIASARRVRSAQGLNVGYAEFPSLETALDAWGLVDVALESSSDSLENS